MKMFKLSLLLASLAIVGSIQGQQHQQYQIHYVVNMHNIGDSTALYQRIATNNESEPYVLGDIVRWMHYPRHRYNEPDMIAEREFGLYKDEYVTVTIDGEQYFISGYDISGNDVSGQHWVEKSLPKRKRGLPWGKILLFGIGGILLFVWIFGSRGGSSSYSGGGSYSGSSSYSDGLERKRQEERRKAQEEAARKRKEEDERSHARWREQLKREGKW